MNLTGIKHTKTRILGTLIKTEFDEYGRDIYVYKLHKIKGISNLINLPDKIVVECYCNRSKGVGFKLSFCKYFPKSLNKYNDQLSGLKRVYNSNIFYGDVLNNNNKRNKQDTIFLYKINDDTIIIDYYKEYFIKSKVLREKKAIESFNKILKKGV